MNIFVMFTVPAQEYGFVIRKTLIIAMLYIIFGTASSDCQSCNFASAQTVGETLNAFASNRAKKYRECHVKLTISTETAQSKIETKVEAWAKDKKLRNDVITSHGRACAIIAGDQYIVQYPGDETPLIASCSDHKDVWEHLGMMHPASIGASDRGFDGLRDGHLRWIFDHGFDGGVLGATDDGVTVLARKSVKIPQGVSVAELNQAGSKEEYFRNHPNALFFEVHLNSELTFSKSQDGELLRFHKVQEKDGVRSRTEISLNNQIELDEMSGIWHPRRCEWVHLSGGALFNKTTVVIDSIDFSDINDSIFTVEGLGLKDGTEVRDRAGSGPGRRRVIADEKLEFPTMLSEQPYQATTNTSSRRGQSFFIGINLILTAVAILIYWYRRR